MCDFAYQACTRRHFFGFLPQKGCLKFIAKIAAKELLVYAVQERLLKRLWQGAELSKGLHALQQVLPLRLLSHELELLTLLAQRALALADC